MTTGFLIFLCLGAGLYTQSVVEKLGATQAMFMDRQIRNGYVAMSDVQRLILVAQKAAIAGAMTPDLDEQFREAADFVYARASHLKSILEKDADFAAGSAAMQALEDITGIADRMIADDYAGLSGGLADLLTGAEVARSRLLGLLEEMRREADVVMATQTLAVKRQQVIVVGALTGLTVIGIFALISLRLEVLGRRARAKAEKRVEFLAFYDPLTELPNRVQFQDRLQKALDEERSPLALLYIDLDRFKEINDTYGHATGDAVLRRLGRILGQAATDHGGFAARLGGDEFALLVPSDDMKLLTELGAQLGADAARPVDIEGATLECGVSIGLATTTQVGGKMQLSVDMLSRVTDFALYTSKSRGRNCCTVYDLALEKRFVERREMLDELPGAIANRHLEVFLQPKVRLPHGTIYGFEALVRWNRNGSLVNPGEFIQLAEESGLVVEIDTYVLNKAARLVAAHNLAQGTDYSVSVNLSAIHFNSTRILSHVEQALWQSDIRPDLLTLEITETTEMSDWEEANEIIRGLRQLGCRISIDDFGTGFSSLAYLRAMVADELKVDRSLVVEIEMSSKARLMLASVLEIARNMNLDVVVEGIENEEQARLVHDMGAARAQGYHFGRPGPASDYLAGEQPRNEGWRAGARFR